MAEKLADGTVWVWHDSGVPLPARVRSAEVEGPSWPECHEAVTDKEGIEQPCGKPAVRDRLDPEEGNPYPVCRKHNRPPYPSAEEVEVHDATAGATDLRDAIVKVIQGWQFADAEVEEFADELLAVVAVRPVAAQERECTCYPGGFSPETYEGPQVWCDEHGLPSAAYEAGSREAVGAQERIDAALRVFDEEGAAPAQALWDIYRILSGRDLGAGDASPEPAPRCKTCMGSGWTGSRYHHPEWSSSHYHCSCGTPCKVSDCNLPDASPTEPTTGDAK